MATNTYKKTQKKKKSRFSLRFFKDRKFHLVFGFFLMLAAVYLFIAFVSYLFTGKTDQSLIEPVLNGDMRDTGLEAKNWLGLLGALVSHYFIFKWFGIASFLIPPLFFAIGYKIVFRKRMAATLPLFRFRHFRFALDQPAVWLPGHHYRWRGSFQFFGRGIGYELALLSHSMMGWGTLLLLAFTLIAFAFFFFNITALFDERWATHSNKPLVRMEEKPVAAIKLEKKPVPITSEDEEEEDEPEVLPKGSISLEVGNHTPKPKTDKTQELALEVEEQPEEEKTADHIENYDPTLDLPRYRYPEPGLLTEIDNDKVQVTKEELESNKDKIVETLINFKIGISSIKATIGPTVTLYEIVPEAGVKISKIKNLEDDIALNLAALGIRIIAPMPGKGTIGIEVPNKTAKW